MGLSSYSFQSKINVDIDSSFYGNFTRMLNHLPCSLANCKFVKNEGDVIIVAVRDINDGEELFVDYGTSYTEPWKD
jgi:SET domain-containing protein